jgi:hypothetical protein
VVVLPAVPEVVPLPDPSSPDPPPPVTGSVTSPTVPPGSSVTEVLGSGRGVGERVGRPTETLGRGLRLGEGSVTAPAPPGTAITTPAAVATAATTASGARTSYSFATGSP